MTDSAKSVPDDVKASAVGEARAAPAGDGEAGDHGEWSDVPLPLDENDPNERASKRQSDMIFALLRELSVETRDERLAVGCALLQRDVQSFTDVTRADATQMIDALVTIKDSAHGRDTLEAIVRQYGAEHVPEDPMPPEDPDERREGWEQYGDDDDA